MPNIGAVLKEEIQRLARKEIRAAVGPLKKKVAELTRANAAYKREITQLLKTVARLEAEAKSRQLKGVRAGAEKLEGVRIGPRSIASQRERLGLSRKDFGMLAGVSSNTIYLWENGEVSPRDKSRGVLVGLRKLGAREAKKLVEAAVEKEKVPSSPRRLRRGKRKGQAKK